MGRQTAPEGWTIHNTTVGTLLRSRQDAPIAVIEPPRNLDGFPNMVRGLERKNYDFVVVVLADSGKTKQIFEQFAKPERVEISCGWEGLPVVLGNVTTKWEVLNERKAKSGSLDQVEAVMRATRDLRVESGRLSAERVAGLFGVSVSDLGGWLGKSRQALNKTPDAPSLQPALEQLERVARLRTLLSDEDFRKWLRMPNPELDGKKPLDLLAAKRWQDVAEMVEDMLTGAPA